MIRSHAVRVAWTGQEPDFAMISGHRASATIADAMLSGAGGAGGDHARIAARQGRPHRGASPTHLPQSRPRPSLNAPAGENFFSGQSDPQAEDRDQVNQTDTGRGRV